MFRKLGIPLGLNSEKSACLRILLDHSGRHQCTTLLPSFFTVRWSLGSGKVKLAVQAWLSPLLPWCPQEKASTKKGTRSQIIWRSSSGHKKTFLHIAQGVLVQSCLPACHQELTTHTPVSTGCFVSHSFYRQERSHLPLSLQKGLLTCRKSDNFSPLKAA